MRYLSGSTRGDLAPLWKSPQTCNEPPPAWTLWAWPLCWKCSPGKQHTLSLPSTWVKLESGLITEDDILLMDHYQVSATSVPTPSGNGSGWLSTGLPCGSIGMVTMGQELVVEGFLASSHSIQIPHPCILKPELLWSDPVGPASTRHSLGEVWSSEEPLWTCLAPKFHWQHASGAYGWQ